MNNSQHSRCLICDSKKLQSLKGFESTFLVKCTDCSFVFSRKIPTEQELITFYDGYGRNDYLSPVTIKRYHELLDKFEDHIVKCAKKAATTQVRARPDWFSQAEHTLIELINKRNEAFKREPPKPKNSTTRTS